MAYTKWARRLAAPVLVAAALVGGALPAPALAAPLIPSRVSPFSGHGAPFRSGSWLTDPPALPAWPAGTAEHHGTAGTSYTAVIANNCDDPSFAVCAAYGGESEYALFRFNADGTGSAVGRISLNEPGVGQVTYYGVLHIAHWILRTPGNPWADFFAVPDPAAPEFYATAGTMDLTTVTPAGTTHQRGLPLGLPFIESGPGALLTWNGLTYPAGDTGVTLKLGLSRITTMYPPLTCAAATAAGCPATLQVPADVPLYLLVTKHR